MDEFLDLRIVKTRAVLMEALFNILKAQTAALRNIKILDVCHKAKIHPMTFYHHFKSKVSLLEYAIKTQLALKLPIPKKLKPKNLKNLIFYLNNFFADFFKWNNLIITNACRFCQSKGYKNSYLDILVRSINFFVYQEINLIIDQQFIDSKIISQWVVGGLLNIYFNHLSQSLTANYAWQTIKDFFNIFSF